MKNVSKSRLIIFILSLVFSVNSYSQIPVYNSYPSATATVFLDFDGQYLEGTSWNYSGPLSLGPGNLTNDQILEIFNRISEDYRPFNINITTDSTKYWSAPPGQRMRVIFTITSDWYGAAGGVSYINSFSWGDNTPCFVFTALLGYHTKWIAEAGSHEIGHTLGLNHQSAYDVNCNKLNEYNAGNGTGEIAWAPIMGVGYYRNFTLWHNGSNPWGCTSYQDDLSIILNNGFGYRTDDHSNTTGNSATQANFVNNRFSVNGVIEKIDDKDFFKFTMPAKSLFHLDANPYNVGTDDNGSDLDVQLDLYANKQNRIGSYNPNLLLSASIDTLLDAGTYYLSVQSSGNMYAPDYASLGSYNLSATYTPVIILPLHRLQLQGTSDHGKNKFNWIIEADETVTAQILEVSFDGNNFQPLHSLNSSARSFAYTPNENGVLYYRLKVTLDNNQQYYSNIFALRNNNNSKPSLVNNLVRNIVQVNSPSPFVYTIIDYSGRILAKGIMAQGINSIDLSGMGCGIYLIRFSNDQEQYTEKIIKQ